MSTDDTQPAYAYPTIVPSLYYTQPKAALAWLQREPRPSLILLDLMMPGLDGWDFLSRRRIDPFLPAIPVVVISGQLLGPERDSVLPADGFVRKPIDMDELLAEVQRHL